MSLETRVTDIHEWVVNALEEDLYRKHVGRFEVQHGEGGFVLGSRSGLEGQVHIGKGNIGTDAFKNIVSFAQERNINMMLETEHDFVREDIELLKSLRK